MRYRKGYKYQLAEPEIFVTSIRPGQDIVTARISLLKEGLLVIEEGCAWDGTSGPVIDRKTNMRGSLGHDALYQLMRMGLLPHSYWKTADRDFIRWIREDGAWRITAFLDAKGLQFAGGAAALPKNRKEVYRAP